VLTITSKAAVEFGDGDDDGELLVDGEIESLVFELHATATIVVTNNPKRI
jgi:hypothetical protein